MSKRAEEASFAYQRELGMIDSVSDEHIVARRMGFCDGYKKAEKDTIEKAVAWLKDYVKYFEIYDEKGIDEFKKAMEKEK